MFIQYYGIFIAIGIIFAYIFTFHSMFSKNIKRSVTDAFFIDAFIFFYILGVFGGRLFFYIFDNKEKIAFLKIWQGGFSVLGASLGGLLGYYFLYYCYFYDNKKVNNKAFSYIAILPVLIHGFGRLGCFFGDCCSGYLFNIPIQLISAAWYFLLFIAGFILWKNNYFTHYFIACYFYIFTVLFERLLFDCFRNDKIIFLKFGNLFSLSKYQMISFIFIVLTFYIAKRLDYK